MLLTTMYVAGVCGLLALAVPWLALFIHPVAAAVAAGALSTAGTLAFLDSNLDMPTKYDIRVDRLFLRKCFWRLGRSVSASPPRPSCESAAITH